MDYTLDFVLTIAGMLVSGVATIASGLKLWNIRKSQKVKNSESVDLPFWLIVGTIASLLIFLALTIFLILMIIGLQSQPQIQIYSLF